MKTCKSCGKIQPLVFCDDSCRGDYNRDVVIRQNTCRVCGNLFPVTTNIRDATLCKRKRCRSKMLQACRAKKERKAAPQQVREHYCVQWRNGVQVRCVVHRESCGAGCYREKAGRAVCRVEPAHVARPSHYSSSLGGVSAVRI